MLPGVLKKSLLFPSNSSKRNLLFESLSDLNWSKKGRWIKEWKNSLEIFMFSFALDSKNKNPFFLANSSPSNNVTFLLFSGKSTLFPIIASSGLSISLINLIHLGRFSKDSLSIILSNSIIV